jgi:hypothetical protein
LDFSSPVSAIAPFEILIGIVLIGATVLSNLYVYGGAYILAIVGIAEGLLSSDVQGLAREIHETMIPFAIAGLLLFVMEVRSAYKSIKRQPSSQKNREIVIALQFFLGGLVTLGGVAFAKDGTYPIGTALGFVHLAVGLMGLVAGFAILKRKSWSRGFLIGINSVTIVYSAFAESLAEIYAYLTPGINDALIGTVIAIIVSGVIIYLLLPSTSSEKKVNSLARIESSQA